MYCSTVRDLQRGATTTYNHTLTHISPTLYPSGTSGPATGVMSLLPSILSAISLDEDGPPKPKSTLATPPPDRDDVLQ